MTCSDQEIAGDYCSGMESHYRDFLELLEERNALYRVIFAVEDVISSGRDSQRSPQDAAILERKFQKLIDVYFRWKGEFDNGRKKRT